MDNLALLYFSAGREPQPRVVARIFIIDMADLASIVAEPGLSLPQYADDCQIYDSCLSDATSLFSTTVSRCLDSIASSMRANRLQLNTYKTEVMWCASTR